MCQAFPKYLLIGIILSSLCITDTKTQTLKADLNPGCDKCPKDLSVFYVSYHSQQSSAHFVIYSSSNNSVPSIFMSSSGVNSTLQFNWSAILDNISTEPAVFLANSFFYGITFTYLIKYNDTRDVAYLSDYIDGVDKIATSDCFWYIYDWDAKPNADGLLSIGLRCNDTRSVDLFGSHGYIELRFTFSNKNQYSYDAPQVILVGGLAVRIKVTMQRLHVSKRRGDLYAKIRWALGLTLVSNVTLHSNDSFPISTSLSINDEIAPGTFKGVTLLLSNDSYATWKAVCYVKKSSAELKNSRSVTVSSQSPLDKSTKKLVSKRSFAPFIFGPDIPAIREVNVSFGDPGDGFYKATKYIHWSFELGLGIPPKAGFSILVWLMIVITGSVLLLSFGLLIFLTIIRFRYSRNAENYERALLNEPENDGEDVAF